jgi:O-succinylbenzoic acid--CoA ligase
MTAECLVDGRLRTADRGRWQHGRLQILGRVDDVIISGGLLIDLAEVERIVRMWAGPGREAVVVGVPHPEWGTALVVVSDGPGELAEVQQLVRRSLPSYAAPQAHVRLPSLPRLASGKPDRQAIRSMIIADRVAS